MARKSDGSVIGAATEITGNVSGSGALLVDGRIRGAVSVDGAVEISAEAQVRGSLSPASLQLNGSLEGDVETQGPIALGPRARYQGVLRGERISIDAGAEVSAELVTEFDIDLSV